MKWEGVVMKDEKTGFVVLSIYISHVLLMAASSFDEAAFTIKIPRGYILSAR